MKKFAIILLALVVTAAMTLPAIAADNLSLSGQMRVRAWLDQEDITDTPVTSNFDQRLRIGGKFTAADGVSATFRMDLTEADWGNNGSSFGAGRMPEDGMQVDRGHLDIDIGDVHLRAGQQYVSLGMGGTVNSQDAGFKVDMNGISAFWILDDQVGTGGDATLLGANYGSKTDDLSFNAYLAQQNDDSEEKVMLIGGNVATSFGDFNVNGQLEIFTGEASSTVDAVGTQLYVDVSTGLGDGTVGGQLLYAAAAADDGTEEQYHNLGNDFGGWDPLVDVGTSLSNEDILKRGRPYEITGSDAGVTAFRGYFKTSLSDSTKVGASYAYATPGDDTMTATDSISLLAVGGTYAVAEKASLQAQMVYTSEDHPSDPESTIDLGFGLFVNF